VTHDEAMARRCDGVYTLEDKVLKEAIVEVVI
jgi:ABC-type lipoprotein export system ATPase subunit